MIGKSRQDDRRYCARLWTTTAVRGLSTVSVEKVVEKTADVEAGRGDRRGEGAIGRVRGGRPARVWLVSSLFRLNFE